MDQQYNQVGESENHCTDASSLKEYVVALASHRLVASAVEVDDYPVARKGRDDEEEPEVQGRAL